MSGRCSIIVCVALLFACAACKEADPLGIKSSGMPYEVLVVADDTVAAQLVTGCLQQPVEGLPQDEPLFDVSVVSPSAFQQGHTSWARAVVTVRLVPDEAHTQLTYRKNVNAKPQMMVELLAQTREALAAEQARWTSLLPQLLLRFELNAQIAYLRQHHLPKMEDSLRHVLDVTLSVPSDMQACKRRQDFFWLSNNATTGMKNLCIMATDGLHDFAHAGVDSLLARHIVGETDAMRMKTLPETWLRSREDGREVVRGLWEMDGDAMGGPFVAHVVHDSLHQRTVTALAFVYAPEMAKRNKVRQLEAALYTVDIGDRN